MSSSNCCFLTCIQISQEAGQVVWYSHLFQNSPQFIVIHTVKGFGIVNKAEIDVFLELSCFFDDPADVGNWSLVPLPFLKPAWTSGCSRFTYCCCTGTGGPRGAIPRWRLGTVAVKRYPLSKVRNSSCALLEQPWRDTPRQGKRNSSKMVSVARGHQRADTLKPYSQKLVNLITLGPQPCLTQWN